MLLNHAGMNRRIVDWIVLFLFILFVKLHLYPAGAIMFFYYNVYTMVMLYIKGADRCIFMHMHLSAGWYMHRIHLRFIWYIGFLTPCNISSIVLEKWSVFHNYIAMNSISPSVVKAKIWIHQSHVTPFIDHLALQ